MLNIAQPNGIKLDIVAQNNMVSPRDEISLNVNPDGIININLIAQPMIKHNFLKNYL